MSHPTFEETVDEQTTTAEATLDEQTTTEDVIFPPGNLWSNEPPMESDLHRRQMELLINSLEAYWHDRQDFYVSGNLTIYFSPTQRKSEDFRGPDFFVVLGAARYDRRSWVVWQEDGKYPNFIIEVLSKETAAVDRGLKRQIYQDTFRTPEYFWFHPNTLEFKGLYLVNGAYHDITPTEQGWLWSQQLGLYLGIHEQVLRFITPEGTLVLRGDEQERRRAEQEHQRAEQERRRAEQERRRAEQAEQELARLQAQLRAMGIDPAQSDQSEG